MEYFKLLIALCVSQFIFFNAMAQVGDEYAKDKKHIQEGEALFLQNCSTCHNFKQRSIGPELSGVTAQVAKYVLIRFIRNSQSVIEGGNPRAVKLFNEFKTPMPSFNHLSNDELESVLAYLNTFSAKDASVTNEKFGPALNDPIPEKIKTAGLTLKLQEVCTAKPSADKVPLARINLMKVLLGKNERSFIVDLNGKLYELKNKKLTEVMDLNTQIPAFISTPGYASGFESFAFHPNFYKNGLFYTIHSEKANSAPADFAYADTIPVKLQCVFSEWKINDPNSGMFAGKRRDLLRIDMPTAVHGMQDVAFNPHSQPTDSDYGLLYVSMGDGGSAEYGLSFLCNSNTQIRASVLRIDPMGNNSKNGQYGVPAINPFANDNDERTLGEIFARGFRNPNRISWTPNGQLLVSDIGLTKIEELNLVQAGRDYGWPVREGKFFLNNQGRMDQVYSLPADESSFKFAYPVAQYDHDEGAAISGGYAYEGSIAALKNKYIFGDIGNGRVFYINYDKLKPGKEEEILELNLSFNGVQSNFKDITNNSRPNLRFGMGANKELYLFTKTDGKIWKVIGSR